MSTTILFWFLAVVGVTGVSSTLWLGCVSPYGLWRKK